MNILIVDDNKHFLDALRFMLEDSLKDKFDHLFEAQNGIECLEIMKNHTIDIVFMDLDMPEMNGIEATKRIVDQFRGVKVIAVSFHSEFYEIQRMIEAGARNYIIKEEINTEILKDCLNNK